MKIYSQTDNGMLYQGDCLEVLRWLPSDSIDTMITDPPYGLNFMGKKWDYDVPGTDVWKECLRVLKPGATALIFAGSRTQHRMAVNVEDAGFILKDTIMWIYGSGFPKSTDISKQIDKIAGKERQIIKDNPNARFVKRNIQSAFERSCDTDKNASMKFITAPATNEAKLWNGWGTALKPAYEPILVAMKPNDGIYAQNALKHGVAGLNIDGGRIEGKPRTTHADGNYDTAKNKIYGKRQGGKLNDPQGRFPANIILDEEAGRLLDGQSGITVSGGDRKAGQGGKGSDGTVSFRNSVNKNNFTRDKGGASRFFYCAKASKSERNGNSHPTVKPLALMDYLVKLTATPTGGTVLDPFAGSGTTGIACIGNNRSYTLIEKETEYCEIIMARLEHAWFKNLCSDS